MNKHFSHVYLISNLCCVLALPVSAAEDAAAVNVNSAATERAYKDSIANIESTQGAYGPDLAETLLGMGLALQSQGRHEEAISQFKRGIHLARVNDGLYSTEQIPLLQGEIASHIASQNYALADERQNYLYRVQTSGTASGQPLTAAFMQQAQWQYDAYQLGLGSQGYTRLMNMWDLYRFALNDVIAREGDSSSNLLPPLYGMLQAQYLISNYQSQEQESGYGEDVRARQNLNRFVAYQSQSYQKGKAVIAAIHGIEGKRAGKELPAAQALVMLGDWHLWHDNQEAASQAYQEAQMELAQQNDAQAHIARIFGAPAALPDIDGLRPLPPITTPEGADILLEFGVDKRGRVNNLQRLDENEEQDRKANRLMRKLRKTKFRPRYDTGHAIETEKVVKAFSIQ